MKYGHTFLSLILCLCGAGASAPAQFAQLKIDTPEFDFGKVSSSQIPTHTFTLANVGSATLYIRDISSS